MICKKHFTYLGHTQPLPGCLTCLQIFMRTARAAQILEYLREQQETKEGYHELRPRATNRGQMGKRRSEAKALRKAFRSTQATLLAEAHLHSLSVQRAPAAKE